MAARLAGLLSLALLFILCLPFVIHSISRGTGALQGDFVDIGRFISTWRWADVGLYVHMITGGVLTALTALQLAGPLRRRWPVVHRVSGRVMITLASVTGVTGIIYIVLNGTIGGPLMNVGFALYGALMLWTAANTLKYARKREFALHRNWALRLSVLALGSWFFRVHYGIWELATDGLATQPDFRGVFDQVQTFAFYIPYLLGLEAILRWQKRIGASA